ncbi:MAG: hypothetical protein RLZZ77_1034 [Bacteroidota bacterium]|jgi:hypothetical protein
MVEVGSFFLLNKENIFLVLTALCASTSAH